ncbi:MAG: hypothetical protein ACI4L7_04080 [Christensenellales bacterium]
MEKRIKMPRWERAKQFAPFDALKGLREALRVKEREHDELLKNKIKHEKIDET